MAKGSRHSSSAWTAYAAAVWALIFAVFHFVWASGWYIGLDAEQARRAFAVRWKLIYDLVAGGMCLVAVPVALALTMPWGRRLPRRLLGFFAWTGTGLLVLRSVASLIQTAYFVATGQFSLAAMGIWEPWFYLGATLFAVSTWRFWRASPHVLPLVIACAVTALVASPADAQTTRTWWPTTGSVILGGGRLEDSTASVTDSMLDRRILPAIRVR